MESRRGPSLLGKGEARDQYSGAARVLSEEKSVGAEATRCVDTEVASITNHIILSALLARFCCRLLRMNPLA